MATKKTEEKKITEATNKVVEENVEKKVAEKKTAVKKPAAKKTVAEKKPAAEKAVAEKKPAAKKAVAEKKPVAKKAVAEKKPAAKKAPAKKTTAKKTAETKKVSPVADQEVKPVETPAVELVETPAVEPVAETTDESPRRSVVFIGSECYPFVKTGGLGDVMYALPKELVKQNCDVRVMVPRYKCIPDKWQEKMIYRGSFDMDLTSDGRRFYVGIMEYIEDGVVYDFIDNEEFFGWGKPYTDIVVDIPKYCYFAKASLAALLYMDWIPDIIHCHDWQAALVPVYHSTMFNNTKLGGSKTIFTIHNLRFQGIFTADHIKYWSGLPDYVFNKDALVENWLDANMLKGGLAYCNLITTVSNTYAGEIQTGFYGEHLDDHLRYHSGKIRGIINGIDYEQWDSATDKCLAANYDKDNVIVEKKKNKKALQEMLGLEVNEDKFIIGLVSRLTNQKGLDILNCIIPQIMDDFTQIVVLGTGDPEYESSFRYYEDAYKGNVSSSIMYDETRAHMIYAGSDAFLVPSLFEPCGLTQMTAMHYGTIPVVRETGGLKDTVEPYNMFENTGNGFTFDRYESGLLLDAINRAKTLFFESRQYWDAMVVRDMEKDFSWENSAKQYKDLYLSLAQW